MAISYSGLSAFHAVAEAESFTGAAKARHVSQPTLSAQVRALEDAYGVRLFDRVGRQIKLTPLGQSLFVITARLFAAQDEAQSLLAGTRTLQRGHLRIAADSATHVMAALARMRENYPGLTFSLTIGNSSEVVDQIMEFAADVAITARQSSDPRLHTVKLRSDRLVAFVSNEHRLAPHDSIPIEAFAGQDIVLRERGSITRETFEARLSEAGIKPANLLEVQSREAVREAVAAGFGIGVIFEAEFRSDPLLKRLVITGADFAVGEYAACRAERRRIPLVRGFFETVQSLADAEAALER
ncbi:MAG TPA: LysR substrate-binding domain-containing protein [Bosea sp. (in: a-proteobacteria)]|jgi:aminoethylphosphonate catabolism LysR family transcriptional regulator|uniref:LysR substrate-binding domain-containing protein n=1 Tax=Bosea sp. (in: a-proteobacteria) TaxID=1871050 RepID=UPI002E105656|nr:LysR substrate-binding domain-containing protein [Bosea sp. (in: a-proteobacteria)]